MTTFSSAIDVEGDAKEQDATTPEAATSERVYVEVAGSEFADADVAASEFIEWRRTCRIQGGMS